MVGIEGEFDVVVAHLCEVGQGEDEGGGGVLDVSLSCVRRVCCSFFVQTYSFSRLFKKKNSTRPLCARQKRTLRTRTKQTNSIHLAYIDR